MMEHKLPYYMAYPTDLRDFDEERREQRDVDYMKSMYPVTAKRLLPYVEEECDRMEYEGSMIYDEYPDRLQLYMMSGRIYDRMKAEEKQEVREEIEQEMSQEAEEEEQMTAQMRRNRRGRKEDPLRDMIDVLLYHEILRRRCTHRRNCRRYY